jgi:hypothetical protein
VPLLLLPRRLKAHYYPPPVPKKTASTPIWTPSDNRSATALTIQTLERRLTLLKRAIKIKSEHEGEERLEDLTRKWKDVARDVSWELWAIVKQNNEDGVGGIVEECGLFTKPSDRMGLGAVLEVDGGGIGMLNAERRKNISRRKM